MYKSSDRKYYYNNVCSSHRMQLNRTFHCSGNRASCSDGAINDIDMV